MDGTKVLRVIYVGTAVEHLPSERCRVRVRLARRLSSALNRTYVGKSEGTWSILGELQCAAEAAVDAIRQAFKADADRLSFAAIKTIDGFDGPAVLVKILGRHNNETFDLVGIGEVKAEPTEAAAKAALGATNRFVTYAFRDL